MKYFVGLATLVAAVAAQTPDGCQSDSDGTFVIQPLNLTNSPSQVDKVSPRRVRALAVYLIDFVTATSENHLRINTHCYSSGWCP